MNYHLPLDMQDVMSTDVFALNFTVEDDIVNVQSVMLDVIASQLNVMYFYKLQY
jgi:hypothetical protein